MAPPGGSSTIGVPSEPGCVNPVRARTPSPARRALGCGSRRVVRSARTTRPSRLRRDSLTVRGARHHPKRARPSSGRADARTRFPVNRTTTRQPIPYVNRARPRKRPGSQDCARVRVAATSPRLAGDAKRPIIHPHFFPTL